MVCITFFQPAQEKKCYKEIGNADQNHKQCKNANKNESDFKKQKLAYTVKAQISRFQFTKQR